MDRVLVCHYISIGIIGVKHCYFVIWLRSVMSGSERKKNTIWRFRDVSRSEFDCPRPHPRQHPRPPYDFHHPYHSCGLRSGFDVNVMRLPFHTVVFYALSSNWLGEKAIIWINAEIWYVFWLYHILNFILPRNVDVFIYVVICLCNCIEARDAWMLRSMATLLKFDAAAFVTIQPFQFHMHEFYWSYLYIYIYVPI